MDSARRSLLVLSATYLLSAFVLWRAQAKKRDVWLWTVTGSAGIVLTLLLDRDRALVWVGLAVVLGPQMVSATIGDLRRGNRLLVAIDLGGLVTLAIGLVLGRHALTG
jgi:hypothetical protein